jgi:hypothetical protein
MHDYNLSRKIFKKLFFDKAQCNDRLVSVTTLSTLFAGELEKIPNNMPMTAYGTNFTKVMLSKLNFVEGVFITPYMIAPHAT